MIDLYETALNVDSLAGHEEGVVALEIPATQRAQVESRLADDIIAWLTTVRPSGMPDTVPVWFVWQDPVFVIYSQPNKLKLRNLEQNPQVSVAIDDTKGGDDVVRLRRHCTRRGQPPSVRSGA